MEVAMRSGVMGPSMKMFLIFLAVLMILACL